MKRAIVLLLPLAACVDQVPGVEGTQSLRVDLIAPADPGSPDDRLDDTARTVTVKVSAIDERDEIDVDFDGQVDVYAQFLGGLTPTLDDPPLDRITLTNGVSPNAMIDLPPVFGPTFLWIEDGSGDAATYATGTSPTLWYRDPFLVDISRPDDETALDALEASPLQGKQVVVTTSQYGTAGRMVVTGVYAQGYTVSDVQCADDAGTPPCVTGDYDHVFVFSFSAPKDENGQRIELGEVIDGFAGAAEEFNGLTEIGFPQSFAADSPVVDEAMIPAPFVLDASFLSDTIQMERREEALVEIDGATLCPLDADYTTYKQWKLDLGNGCGDPVNVISNGVVDFDPADYVGMVLPRVVGTLRPVNIGTFNVWIIYPRFDADVTLP